MSKRCRRRSRHRCITGEQTGEGGVPGEGIVEAQFGEQGVAVGDVFRLWNGCRRHRNVVAGEDGSGAVVTAINRGVWIRPQVLQQGIVDPLRELLEAVRSGWHGVGPAVCRCYGGIRSTR